jgi:branched-chain amino acid transport system permease protein
MNLNWLDAFLVYGLFSVMMIIGLALLLHLQLGLARIANFGIDAFGVMYVRVDWPFGDIWAFLISIAFGTLVAGIAGIVVGWVIADLDIDGVLVGTLGFATCVLIVATTEQDLTGGALGMGGLGFPYNIGSVKANETLWLVILTIVVALILYYVSRVHKSPYGRKLIAVGDNEPLARALGKQTFRTKLWLFAGSSAMMGFLGAMFGVMERFLDIGNLGIEITLAAMVGLVLGGTTRTWGAVVGVALTVAVFDILIQSYVPLPQSWYGQAIPVLREMTFGAALILVLMFRPFGVLGRMRRDKLMRRMHGG